MKFTNIPPGLIVFLLAFFVYIAFSNFKPAIYNHHVYLAQSFLEGRFDLPNPPSHFNDVAIVDGKNYFIYGPMGAILLLPLVFLFGLSAPEGLLNIFLASLNVFLFYQIVRKTLDSEKMRLVLTFFFAFGTLHFFSAAHDQTWWYVYIVFSFFTLATLYETLVGKRVFLIGLLSGFAYMARLEAIFVLLFPLIVLNIKEISLKKTALLLAGFSFPFFVNSLYNFLRFGNIFDTGQANFVLREPGAPIPYGLFSPKYFAYNFYTYFIRGPEIISSFPFFRPPWMGMGIILTTPAFLYALNAKLDRYSIAAWVSTILISIPSLTYYLPGWTEFGWKHSVLFTPLLGYLTARGMGKNLNFLKISLISWSIIAQLWGVLWWRIASWFY